MNYHIFDIIFILFLSIMAILGYMKGFVTRLYDLIGSIVVLFLSYFLMKPVASIWKIYPYENTDVLTTLIGQIMNQILVFIVLFVILTIIKKVIGLFIKPLLRRIMDIFKITSLVDHLLGVILSLAEALFISYLCIIFVVIPFYDRHLEKIQNTMLVKHVVNIVPDAASKMSQLTSGFELVSLNDIEMLTKLMLTANDFYLIDDEQFEQIFQEHVEQQLDNYEVALSSSQIQKLKDILLDAGYTNEHLNQIISKINVSDDS